MKSYVIYFNPSDFPGRYVVRVYIGDHPTEEHQVCSSLDLARGCVPDGLIRIPRDINDDPVILETWM